MDAYTDKTANSLPPLTILRAQTESSTSQAQFAAQVAARLGKKGKQDNEKKADDTSKDKEIDQVDQIKTEANKQGNDSVLNDVGHGKVLSLNNVETAEKLNSLSEDNRTDAPKKPMDHSPIRLNFDLGKKNEIYRHS